MQGDQSRELSQEEELLLDALDSHFDEGCCGTLDFVAWIRDEFGTEVINCCQFHCRKCYRILQIDL